MGHFTKHWPADKVEEVEDAVRNCVSRCIFCSFLHITNSAHDSILKFMERYDEKTSKAQPKAACVRKAVHSPTKLGRHRNVDNTDSSDDEDCQQAISKGDAYLEEWNLYLNTH